MAGPDYGAIGATFKICRGLQVISLLACIGMAANFISVMNQNNELPSKELVGTLSVACIAIIYCVITVILHIDSILPYLLNTGVDGLMLIALTVVAAVIGKPLSYLNCKVIGTASVSQSAYQLGEELKATIKNKGHGSNLIYSNWISANQTTCYQMKAIWGLGIALCILFAFSAICSVFLWRRSKTVAPKDMA